MSKMNAIDFAELRVTLDGMGMRNWTIRRDPLGDEDDWLVQGNLSGASLHMLHRAPFYLEKPDTGEIVDIYKAVNFRKGNIYLWQVRVRDIKANTASMWLPHTELEGALGYLSTQLFKEGRLT